MTCIHCGETRSRRAPHTFRRTIAGWNFNAEVEVDACAACGRVHVPVDLVLAFDRAVAADLARHGPVSGVTFRFIRKAVPLQPIEVARMLSVPVETVSRWEAGIRAIDVACWLVIATIALETFDGPSPLLPRLDALRVPVPSNRPVALEAPPKRRMREVLEMASGPVMLTDGDIAEALDVDAPALRARLEELAAAGVVYKKEVQPSGAIRWECCDRDLAALLDRARGAGVDVDAFLPPAVPGTPDPRTSPPASERVVPASSRA